MKKIIILFAVIMLAGCSTKFAYKNADWLVHWFIDDYIDMTRDQKDAFDDYFAQWMSWHKETQLPLYLDHFKELTNDIRAQAISLERMDYHQDKAREHWTRARAHVAPDLVSLAATMDDEQVTYLFAKLEKKNKEDEEERAERAQKNPEKRKERWIKRNQDNIENWLGKLTDEQERLIENQYDNFLSNGMQWIEYRRNYQQALRQVFVKPDRGENFEAELLLLLNNPEAYRSDELLARSESNEAASKLYMLSLFTLSTEEQREHLIDEINDWQKDIIDLLE